MLCMFPWVFIVMHNPDVSLSRRGSYRRSFMVRTVHTITITIGAIRKGKTMRGWNGFPISCTVGWRQRVTVAVVGRVQIWHVGMDALRGPRGVLFLASGLSRVIVAILIRHVTGFWMTYMWDQGFVPRGSSQGSGCSGHFSWVENVVGRD